MTGRRGMTLVELMLASTVTVLVAGSAVMVFRGTATAQDRIDRQASTQQEARAAIEALAAALRNAHRPSDEQGSNQQEPGGAPPLEGLDEWRGGAPADRIRFMTLSRRTLRRGQPESDVREVEFFIASPEPGRPPALMRRTDPTLNPRPDDGGVVERVASGVSGLDIEYHDGRGWREQWRPERPAWPVAIRLRVIVEGAPGEDGSPATQLAVNRLIGFIVPPGPDPKAEQPETAPGGSP